MQQLLALRGHCCGSASGRCGDRHDWVTMTLSGYRGAAQDRSYHRKTQLIHTELPGRVGGAHLSSCMWCWHREEGQMTYGELSEFN